MSIAQNQLKNNKNDNVIKIEDLPAVSHFGSTKTDKKWLEVEVAIALDRVSVATKTKNRAGGDLIRDRDQEVLKDTVAMAARVGIINTVDLIAIVITEEIVIAIAIVIVGDQVQILSDHPAQVRMSEKKSEVFR